jgi:hypothetical protein
MSGIKQGSDAKKARSEEMESFFDGDDESNKYFVEKSPASWKVRGHGTYEEIDGDDAASAFFQLAKDHERLVIHFYRGGTSACEIMHNHLEKIAKQHLETKFVKLNMEKNSTNRIRRESLSYLEEKLGLEVMPTLALIKRRKQVHHLLGFRELGGRKCSTFTLKKSLERYGVLTFTEAEKGRAILEAGGNVIQQRQDTKKERDAEMESFFDGDDDSNSYCVENSPSLWKVRGHGTYEEIDEDDAARAFFQLAKDHERLIVHFYRIVNSPDCEVMHKHLEKIARQHLETKFVKLNMEKTSTSGTRRESLSYLERKLGLQVMPTVALIKGRKQVHHLLGFEELGGKDCSTFAMKKLLERYDVLKFTEAEKGKAIREADSRFAFGRNFKKKLYTSIPSELKRPSASDKAPVGIAAKTSSELTKPTALDVATVATGTKTSIPDGLNNAHFVPFGATFGVVAKAPPIGWGPIPSFDYQSAAKAQNEVDDTTTPHTLPTADEGSTPYAWGPVASLDESTLSGMENNVPFDATKLPAASFAAVGAAVGVIIEASVTSCSKLWTKAPSKNLDENSVTTKDASTPIFAGFECIDGEKRAKRFSLPSFIAAFSSFLATVPSWAIRVSVGSGLVVTATLALLLSPAGSYLRGYSKTVHVAFLGNSVQYYNDFPRFMEVISSDHIVQNSCMHEDATIVNLLQSGNGMLKKFNTNNARIGGSSSKLFDYGACTVHQLLFGYDRFLYKNWKNNNASSSNSDYTGAYNDGLNPCYADSNYLTYVTKQFKENPVQWDYVVMNDNTMSPGLYKSRQQSLASLTKTYANWFTKIGATPVFLDTPAYWSSFRNLSIFVDVPTFTSVTYEGYRKYALALGKKIPAKQKPRIAPVGIAYLTVWEDNYEMWTNLFHYDGIHASPHGTYLQGCVVYHTLFGRMPDPTVALPESISTLFSRARRLQPPSQHRRDWPTRADARYLYSVAKKVSKGYKPASFITY